MDWQKFGVGEVEFHRNLQSHGGIIDDVSLNRKVGDMGGNAVVLKEAYQEAADDLAPDFSVEPGTVYRYFVLKIPPVESLSSIQRVSPDRVAQWPYRLGVSEWKKYGLGIVSVSTGSGEDTVREAVGRQRWHSLCLYG